MPRRRISPAAVVFALLVLATLGAFAYAQRLKRDPLLIDRTTFGRHGRTSFTPNGDCVNDTIRIRFRTTTSNDATVQIVKPGGKVEVTLARGEFLKRYHFHTYLWNGYRSGSGLAPPGRYKLRVKLEDEGRTLVLPGTIHLHRAKKKNDNRICATFIAPGGAG